MQLLYLALLFHFFWRIEIRWIMVPYPIRWICVCVREREGEGERVRKREAESVCEELMIKKVANVT